MAKGIRDDDNHYREQTMRFCLATDLRTVSSGSAQGIFSVMPYYLRPLRRAVVLMAGIIVLLLGIVMLIAPGPGILTMMLGLGILATEFVWARRLLKRIREKAIRITNSLLGRQTSLCTFHFKAVARWNELPLFSVKKAITVRPSAGAKD